MAAESNAMTVCIAAICHRGFPEGDYIVGAADRMMTVGDGSNDIEYEPPIRKLHGLTSGVPNVIAMVAGNMTVHSKILPIVRNELAGRGRVPVEDAAEAYGRAFREYRRLRAEREVLEPLGLTYETMTPSDDVSTRLYGHHLYAEAIIAGVDSTGAHLYRISDPGHPYCFDSGGFVAIGIGASNAESQLMLERYAPHWHFRQALFALYTAKVRGEAAPGVGNETDVCWVGPNTAYASDSKLIEALGKAYENKRKRDDQSRFDAEREVSAFLNSLRDAQQGKDNIEPEKKPEAEAEATSEAAKRLLSFGLPFRPGYRPASIAPFSAVSKSSG